MEKLIGMTDFVLKQRSKENTDNIRRFWACERYAKFLKQPLTLGMFVPCDSDGNVLKYVEKPLSPNTDENWYKWTNYVEAKERVLFEENLIFKLWDNEDVSNSKIEDLLTDYVDYFLNESAIKRLEL